MARRPDRRATYRDIENLPDNVVGEILDGELVVSPRPASPHAYAGSGIGIDIGGPFHGPPGGARGGGPGGWWILDEPELHFHGDVVVPDLAGWRTERMSKVPNTAHFTLPPDWVCEVLSPSTARWDRSTKLAIYAREAVKHLWYVDPVARTFEVMRLEHERWTILAAHGPHDEKVRAEPFEAIEIELSRWWLPEEEPKP